jgi:hypothetical protein
VYKYLVWLQSTSQWKLGIRLPSIVVMIPACQLAVSVERCVTVRTVVV